MILKMSRPSLKMKAVRTTCNKAPEGPNKQAALNHLTAAREAQKAMSEAETNNALDAAKKALL
ncbi:hypothetical protein FGG78_30585 [Thioclava sp. BHET1]|nr:hypothetical protein FGG78_30585 [Thioclava sp. BHET1]